MDAQPKALWLARELDAYPTAPHHIQAAAELRRLHTENERLSATVKAREDEILTHSEAFYEATRLLSEEREKNERLATEVANRNRRALAGDEAVSALANVHAYYEGLEAQCNALLGALRTLVQNEGLDAYAYLDKGIGTATAAGQRWLNARAVIAAAKGEENN